MNDAELVTSVRESVAEVHSTTPVEQIVSRGRAVRARRRIPGVAGALAVVAGAALAVTALAPSGHQASHQGSHQPTARLAAWTVTKLADGNISVTINQLKDPAGLQSTLRSDGIPASVTFGNQQNPACQPYPGGTPGSSSQPPTPLLPTPLLKRVFPKPYRDLPPQPSGPPRLAPGPPGPPPSPSANTTVIVIDPAALPGHAGVQIGASFHGSFGSVRLPTVVYASTQCTGS
jgi:hypothetical protein